MYIRKGSSSALFKFLEEKVVTMEPITNWERWFSINYLDTDLRRGIKKAELALRLSDFYGHGLKDTTIDP